MQHAKLWYRLKKKEPLIALGLPIREVINFCVCGTPPSAGDDQGNQQSTWEPGASPMRSLGCCPRSNFLAGTRLAGNGESLCSDVHCLMMLHYNNNNLDISIAPCLWLKALHKLQQQYMIMIQCSTDQKQKIKLTHSGNMKIRSNKAQTHHHENQ